MRRWLAWCLCACACFRETDTGGVGDHGDASSSSTAGTGASASTTSATGASSVTSSTGDSATTAMTEVTSDDSGTIASETTAGGCSEGVAVPPHEGWMGPVAIGMDLGRPTGACKGGMEPVAWGLADGATPTCSCHCQGGPSVLCNIEMTFGDSGCMASAVMLDDCNNLGSIAYLQANVSGVACNPDVALLEIADDDANVYACALPPPVDDCVVVPEGFTGPCVMGGEGECPDGYSPRDAIGAVQGCESCTPGCSTVDYCDSVVVTPYSALDCPAANALAPLPLDGACHMDLGPAVAVGFAAPAEPACPDVPGTVLHHNVCCVP